MYKHTNNGHTDIAKDSINSLIKNAFNYNAKWSQCFSIEILANTNFVCNLSFSHEICKLNAISVSQNVSNYLQPCKLRSTSIWYIQNTSIIQFSIYVFWGSVQTILGVGRSCFSHILRAIITGTLLSIQWTWDTTTTSWRRKWRCRLLL